MASKYAGLVQEELRDLRGNAMTGAVVKVYNAGTSVLATLYNNPVEIAVAAGGDALANDGVTGLPAAAGLLLPGLDANANYTFYADADAEYDLNVTHQGTVYTYRVKPYLVRGAGGVESVNGQTGVVDLSGTYVDTTTAQTVGGNKDFTGTVKRNGTHLARVNEGPLSLLDPRITPGNTRATWQSALDLLPATGGAIYVPPGDYTWDGGIVFDKRTTIIAAGRDLDGFASTCPVRVNYAPSLAGPAIQITTSACKVGGFLLRQTNALADCDGVVISGAHGCVIEDMTILSCTAFQAAIRATTAASAISNQLRNVRGSGASGLEVVGNLAAAKSANANSVLGGGFYASNPAGRSLKVWNTANENVFTGVDFTTIGAQTLVQVGDGSAATARGNSFYGVTAENGAVGFDLMAGSTMTWIMAFCTSTTQVQAAAGVRAWFLDTKDGTWRTYGNTGFSFDEAGNFSAGGGAFITGINFPTGWALAASGSRVIECRNDLAEAECGILVRRKIGGAEALARVKVGGSGTGPGGVGRVLYIDS